eukprot:2385604-Rhodomonas_salina.1
MRKKIQQSNPAQVGFSADPSKKVTIRFDDVREVRSAKEMASLLTENGWEFSSDKQPEDYIIFTDNDVNDVVKVTAQVLQTQRVVDAISGERPFLIDLYLINNRVYSTQNLRKGKVLKLEGAVCSFIKRLHALGIPLNQILWQITECLMSLGLSPRSVYLDDDGAARRM